MRLSSLIVVLAALLIVTGCKKKSGQIILKEAAVSVWDDNVNVGTQMQLANVGNRPANQLRLTRIDVEGGTYAGPTGLPTTSLGDLKAGGDIRFDAILKLAATDGSPHVLTVEGDYREDGKQVRFRAQRTINPNAAPPGPVTTSTGTVGKQNPATVPYPSPAPSAPFGPNSEQPIFVPIGPPRQLFTPTPTGDATWHQRGWRGCGDSA